MDAKVVAAETTPYASEPSDENSVPTAAGGGNSVSDEAGIVSGEGEFESGSDRTVSAAGNFEKSNVIGVNNSDFSDVGSLASPVSGSFWDEERPPSLGGGDLVSPKVTSSLSPMLKETSDEMDVGGSVEKETFEDAMEGNEYKLENVSVDVEEKEESTGRGLDEKPISDEFEEENVMKSENKVKGMEEIDDLKNDSADNEVSKEKEIVSIDIADDDDEFWDGDSIVDSSVMESVHGVDGTEEVKVDDKFDQIDHDDEDGQSDKSIEEAGDSIVDSSTVNSIHISPAEPGVVVVGIPKVETDAGLDQEDPVDQSSPKVEEFDNLTAAYDGNFEAKVESDGIELERVREGEEARVTESSNVGSEESSTAAEANLEYGEIVSEEGIQVEGEDYGSESDDSEAAKQFLEELEKGSHSDEASNNQSEMIDGQIMTDSEDEIDTDDDGGENLFDSAALTALLKAATGGNSESGNFTITSQDGTRIFSMEPPAGLGSSLPSLKPTAARSNRSNIFTQSNVTTGRESESNLSEDERTKLEKLQSLRVKYLRLVQRLGHSAEDSVATQVLYRLSLLAGRQTGQIFSLDSAKKMAMELEAEGKDDLDFSLNILVLGKPGVGKSATVNSIFGDPKASIDAFEPSTTSIREISGTVRGVKITVIDTPGLKSSSMDQSTNSKLLSSVKRVTKKCPADIVLYVDRLDTQTRDLNSLPLLRTITATLGSSIWKNAILTLTHAASAPPDGPSGSPLSYDVFVAQCSHIVQQSIGKAVGDLRLMNPSLMNPVSLVENHPLCRKNRDGEKVLPNGQTWRPQLLLLCYSLKILSEANSVLKPQEPLDHRKLFGFRVRSPPLPYLLSWLLQSRTHPKLSTDQGGDSVDSDIELDDVSDSEQEDREDEEEYDQLPPFKPLKKKQLSKLTKEQRKAYFEEYDYRVKLLQKKQWKEELRRMKEMKKSGKKVGDNENGFLGEDEDPENTAPATVPVALPDMILPPSFDSDNPAYRYRFLEPNSQLLTRPVLDTHGWDHDYGYDGVNVEHSLSIANHFPSAVTVQVTKDKKEFNIHLDSSISAKHGENGSTMAGFDIQNVGKQVAYVVRGETKFRNLKKNKTTLGGSVTFLGENVATGVKLEDQISIGKRLVLVGSTGTIRSRNDSAYGANVEIRLREADFPIGQDQSSLGLSLVKWRGDLAVGANFQSQVSVGRHSKIAVRAGLNNKMSGQITVRTSSSDQLQIALAAVLPIVMSIYKSIRPGSTSDKYSMY